MDWRDEFKIWLDVMSGDREERDRSGYRNREEELSINDEIGLMCGGVARGHRGGNGGRMDGWMAGQGTRINLVERGE